jgi:hypothetical protein
MEGLLNRKWLFVTKEMACEQIVGFTKTAKLRNVGKLLYELNGNTNEENWKRNRVSSIINK